jgi:hypothetical protein
MGTYNTIRGENPCIRCGAITPIEAHRSDIAEGITPDPWR